MIDEIDYFPRRDKYKKKKGIDLDEDWNALKKTKTVQDSRVPPAGKTGKQVRGKKNGK
ncbi:MAG: hypothetical protein ACE5E9_08745 [Nitrospinaceae bacterium]